MCKKPPWRNIKEINENICWLDVKYKDISGVEYLAGTRP
jgi:hypothetical protein